MFEFLLPIIKYDASNNAPFENKMEYITLALNSFEPETIPTTVDTFLNCYKSSNNFRESIASYFSAIKYSLVFINKLLGHGVSKNTDLFDGVLGLAKTEEEAELISQMLKALDGDKDILPVLRAVVDKYRDFTKQPRARMAYGYDRFRNILAALNVFTKKVPAADMSLDLFYKTMDLVLLPERRIYGKAVGYLSAVSEEKITAVIEGACKIKSECKDGTIYAEHLIEVLSKFDADKIDGAIDSALKKVDGLDWHFKGEPASKASKIIPLLKLFELFLGKPDMLTLAIEKVDSVEYCGIILDFLSYIPKDELNLIVLFWTFDGFEKLRTGWYPFPIENSGRYPSKLMPSYWILQDMKMI